MEAVLGATARRDLEVTHMQACRFASTTAPTVAAALSKSKSKSRTPPTHPPPSCQSTTTTLSSNHRLSSPKQAVSLSFFLSFLPWGKPTRLDARQSRTSRLHCEPVLISPISLSYAHAHVVSGASRPVPSQVDKLLACSPARLPALSFRYASVTDCLDRRLSFGT